MKICGIKITHDASIALIDNGKLVFCYEIEKLNNNQRYSAFSVPVSKIAEILGEYGYALSDIDLFVMDGWFNGTHSLMLDSQEREIRLGEYGDFVSRFGGDAEDLYGHITIRSPEFGFTYTSYKHILAHIMAAYCTSPYSSRNQDSFVLIWDGGVYPRLFYYKSQADVLEDIGSLFPLIGTFYAHFANEFEPFNQVKKIPRADGEARLFHDSTTAGKVMAYIANGKVNAGLLGKFKTVFESERVKHESGPVTGALNDSVFVKFIVITRLMKLSSADVLATLHQFLEELLVENLGRLVERHPAYSKNMCFAGGCALNIKWNSALRSSGIIDSMWVPPFPNDAGNAIGAACIEMVRSGIKCLDWNVYLGPGLVNNHTGGNWSAYPFTPEQLAVLMHAYGEPVVFLNERAELGPRALGNRSILAPAVKPGMKQTLNDIKHRENYRPVAPICMEEDAPAIFDPGTPDPYMLYDHVVREAWIDRIPAVIHLDNTARLQTVSGHDNSVVYRLLKKYKELSGIPLLCNTSANFNGKGFFPDVQSVMAWDRVNFIWSNDTLYVKKEHRFNTEPGHSPA